MTTRTPGGAPFSGSGSSGDAGQSLCHNRNYPVCWVFIEEEETAQTQYEPSKTERVIADGGANLKRLSVAVLVDGVYEDQKTEDGKIQKVYSPKKRRYNTELQRW